MQTIFVAGLVNGQRLFRGDECRSSKPCALREPAFASFLSRNSSGLAACKTLASKQGSFFLSRAVRFAISSHRMAVEPSQQQPRLQPRGHPSIVGGAQRPTEASGGRTPQHHCDKPSKKPSPPLQPPLPQG